MYEKKKNTLILIGSKIDKIFKFVAIQVGMV
ncbi:Uncharacterised protein [Helicobacter fennelliae]|nr:Uncharacterised protein [Helicobacter fennelliae]STP07606.1 Uncharacterised protein [Helicobacter fennelliae]